MNYRAISKAAAQSFAIGAVALCLGIGLAACGNAVKPTPEQEAVAKEAERIKRLEIRPLFKQDGCTVYAFYHSGRDHYYAACPGASVASSYQTGGKIKETHDETIMTVAVPQ